MKHKHRDSKELVRKEEGLELAGRLELLRLSLEADSVHVVLTWKRDGFDIHSVEQSRIGDSAPDSSEETEGSEGFVDNLVRKDIKRSKPEELSKKDSYYG